MPLDLDDIMKALAHPVRREILGWLKTPAAQFLEQVHSTDHGVCAGRSSGAAGCPNRLCRRTWRSCSEQAWSSARKSANGTCSSATKSSSKHCSNNCATPFDFQVYVMTTLFDPITLGDLELPNRIIMAPLTRCRADAGRVPNALMAEYYVQRASAGLIISEATSVSPMGVGYPDTPGIWSAEQVRAGPTSPMPCMPQAAESSCSCGTWAAFPIHATSMASCRSHPVPSSPRGT